jgi:plasmid stabilization system protein ParE
MAPQQFRLSRQAIADLEGISEYLGKRSPAAADRVIDALFETFDALAVSRELGTRLENLRSGLRMFVPLRPADKYVVFYYLVPDGVMISDVVHSARNWFDLFSRGER